MTGEGDMRCEYERPTYQSPMFQTAASRPEQSGEYRRRACPRDAGDTHPSNGWILTHSLNQPDDPRPADQVRVPVDVERATAVDLHVVADVLRPEHVLA